VEVRETDDCNACIKLSGVSAVRFTDCVTWLTSLPTDESVGYFHVVRWRGLSSHAIAWVYQLPRVSLAFVLTDCLRSSAKRTK
jgi:hypothetical protein